LEHYENSRFRTSLSQETHIGNDIYKGTKNGINLNNDTELLDIAYFDILNKLTEL